MTFSVNSPPSDIISKIIFADSRHLLASSWGKSVGLYDAETASQLYGLATEAPVLDCAFYLPGNPNLWTYCGLDKRIHYHDVTSQKDVPVGTHDDVVKCVAVDSSKGMVISGSWDRTLKGWTLGVEGSTFSTPVSDKVYAMALCDNFLAVGTADRSVSVFDTRKISQPFFTRSTGFSQHIRSLQWLKGGEGYAVSSSEGKVAVEYVTSSKKAFAFKCHRVVGEDKTVFAYPVNALAVHPNFGSLATGGSDASICFWDINSRKKISRVQLKCSIQSLSFNEDGQRLAIACSDNTDGGIHESPDPHSLLIHGISEPDVRLGPPLPPSK